MDGHTQETKYAVLNYNLVISHQHLIHIEGHICQGCLSAIDSVSAVEFITEHFHWSLEAKVAAALGCLRQQPSVIIVKNDFEEKMSTPFVCLFRWGQKWCA